ncbi:competence type IV pilus minor pilin ComGG [Alteribacter natronophilus]|uniref:competence type IV pilus minor pilin ComGG n=1 Tax=Alteribacter natronophilus TaxID=2583810 RepID=UPI0014872C96|nr:competence type IV pilus minor pilin ComGG [Alteribacter natronophilus]
MNRNDRGFILFLTAGMLVLLSAGILQLAASAAAEREFNYYHREMIIADHLLMTGAWHVTGLLLSGEGDTLASGKVKTGDGSVSYTIERISDTIHCIRLEGTTHKGSTRSAVFKWDPVTGAVEDWREGSAVR